MMTVLSMAEPIESFRRICFDSYTNDIEVISKEDRRQLSAESLHNGLPEKVHKEMYYEPMENICTLVKTPRMLKMILRRTYRAWERLHGEIDLDSILVANTLRFATPEAFEFLIKNYEEVSAVPRFGSQETRTKLLNAAEGKWDKATESVKWDAETAKKLIAYLFPGWAKIHIKSPALQGINNTEYWIRFLAEELKSDSFQDQEVLRLLAACREKTEGIMVRNTTLPMALCTNDEFVSRFEYLAQYTLTGQEIRQVTSTIFEQALNLQGVIASRESIAGFYSLWKLSTQQPIDERMHLDWVKDEIFKALPRSLHFSNDIYYYWSSNSESDVHKKSNRIKFHAEIVSHARDLFEGNPNDFIRTLDPIYMYSSFHFSILLSSPEHGGPGFIAADWIWFALLLLDAGEINPQVIVPQISIFLIEESVGGGSYSYAFNEDRCSELFGDEKSRLMEILSTEINVNTFDFREKKRIQLMQEVALDQLEKNN